jgi:hypothetical protein
MTRIYDGEIELRTGESIEIDGWSIRAVMKNLNELDPNDLCSVFFEERAGY